MLRAPTTLLADLSHARMRRLIAVVSLIAIGAGRPSSRASAADIDVWIDVGHGGPDIGAKGFDQVGPYPEKTAALEVSGKLFNVLGAFGYSSFQTRYNDNIYPTLSQRVLMANGQESNHAAEQGTCQA